MSRNFLTWCAAIADKDRKKRGEVVYYVNFVETDYFSAIFEEKDKTTKNDVR